jgi:hypothetical protein
LQEPLPSSTRARSLAYLLLVAVACRAVPLLAATPRRGRVRARARDRAGPTPLRPGAPQHTRTPIRGQGRALYPVRLRFSSPPPSRAPASPRPCRGRASRARGRQGEGHRFLGRHGRPCLTEPRRAPVTYTPANRGRRARRRPWRRAGLRHDAATTPRRDPNPAFRLEKPDARAHPRARRPPSHRRTLRELGSSPVAAPPPRPRRRWPRTTPPSPS